MSLEVIPCLVEIDEVTGMMQLTPVRPLNLRPGEYAEFTGNPPQVVVHRVWFGRRWFVASRAYLTGKRGPNLEVRGK